jgi:lipopolysaccharide export system permease protein
MAVPGWRLLDRFILSELAGPFALGVFSFTMIFVTGDLLVQAAKLIIERGIAPGIVMRLFLYRLPEVIALTLPMSCLLSTLLGMMRLSANSELIALKSLGVSFYRILAPVMLASFLISAGALTFNETVVPFTTQAAENLMRYEILHNQASALQEKVFMRDERNGELQRVIYLGRLDVTAGVIKDIVLHEFDNGRLVRTSLSPSGHWRDGEWWIEDGQVFEVTEKGQVRLLFRFERQKLALTLSPKQLQHRTKRPIDMSARELWDAIEQAGAGGADVSQFQVFFHLKLAVPWACVIMAVLGASFGASRRGRSGSGIGFAISFVIVFAYYIVMSLCRVLGERGLMTPLLAAWFPNGIFLAIGLFFSRRVD